MGEVYLSIEARITEIQAGLKSVQDGMTKLENKSEEVNKTMRTEFESTGKVTNELKGMISGLFTVGAITAFVKKMIDLRVEWTRQTAVIKTLTGSQKEAESSMKMLDRVARASLTPLKEISDAYIRLVNQGIKPSYSEMKKMADVAVASGKSFGQLAEAIFDATNGQTRGLRDFGIQSKMVGDKVQLSFRGITDTVDLTGESITDFVIKMGEMNGIAGATDAVAKTLGGSINLLGEEFDDLVRTLGKFSEGEIVTSVKILSDLLSIVNSTIELTSSDKANKTNEFYKNMAFYLASLIPVLGDVAKGMRNKEIFSEFLGKAADKLKKVADEQLEVKENTDDASLSIEKYTKWIHGLVEEMNKGVSLDKLAEQQRRAAIEFAQMMQEIPDEQTEFEWIIPPPKKTKKLINDTEDLIDGMYGSLESKREEFEAYWDLKNQARTEKEQLQADTLLQINDFVATMFMRGKDAELKAAGDSADKKEQIERKYANRAKLFSISQALIQGLLAMQKNRAELGTVFAAPVNLWQAILTAVTIATIAAQKFATGILDLKGRGTGTSDEIPAMLSRGESVMTAKETHEFYPYLKAMKEGKFPKLQLELMKDFAGITNNNLNYDNSKEIKELRNVQKILKDLKGSETIEGKYKVIRRGGITTKISLN